jgi:HEAT repeat protein
LHQLLTETEDRNKTTLAVALGASNYRPAIPKLIELLRAEMSLLRGCAAQSLGELTAIEAEAALVDALAIETDAYAKERMNIALQNIRQSRNPESERNESETRPRNKRLAEPPAK